ncbi:MAG: hypothetical protein ACRC5C_01765 [Bacilli bacterium]
MNEGDKHALAYIERLERESNKRGYAMTMTVQALNMFGKMSEIVGSDDPVDVFACFMSSERVAHAENTNVDEEPKVNMDVLRGLDVNF